MQNFEGVENVREVEPYANEYLNASTADPTERFELFETMEGDSIIDNGGELEVILHPDEGEKPRDALREEIPAATEEFEMGLDE